MLTGSSMCGKPWAFCAPIETSSPYSQFLFTLMKGDSKKKLAWALDMAVFGGWQLILGSSKLSSHGQNSEQTVLCEQLKLTLWIRQHVQLNYIT